MRPYVTWNLHSLELTRQHIEDLKREGKIYQPDPADPAMHYPTGDDESMTMLEIANRYNLAPYSF